MSDSSSSPIAGSAMTTSDVVYGRRAAGAEVQFAYHQLPGYVRTGTFTANGASAVTVADVNVTASSAIIITLKTVGGTVGAVPAIKTITAGTGFTVAATAGDTSTYNYAILG